MSKFPDVDFIYLNINKLLSSVVRGIQKIPWKAENNCWMLSWKYYQLYCLAHYWNLCSDNHICVAKGCYALNHSDHLLLAFSIHTTAYTTVITILLPPFFLQWPFPPSPPPPPRGNNLLTITKKPHVNSVANNISMCRLSFDGNLLIFS